MLHIRSRTPRLPGLAFSHAGYSSHSTRGLKGAHKVFTCPGIEDAALMMRRCTQAAIGIEVFGSQWAKICFHSGDLTNFHSVAEQAMVMNTFVMLLHCGAMWWYQSYTRDHILARHVTSITLEKSFHEMRLGEPVIAFVETRPWTHRLEFRPRSRNDIVSLGRLREIGAINIDQTRGAVHDEAAFELLLDDVWEITSESVEVDMGAKTYAHVGDYEVTPLQQEDDHGAYAWIASIHPVFRKPLQLDGRFAYWNFCIISLGMGVGSVLLFLPEGIIPQPSFLKPQPTRTFKY